MESLTKEEIKKLKFQANEIRKSIIKMLYEAGSGHTAGSMGMADIFTLLYFHVLRHDPKNPMWEERDRLILSNGHICPTLYATMAHAGYFPIAELNTLRKFGSRLQGHPHRKFLPYMETSSGPLGSGLSQAIGMALALKMDNREKETIYCIVSDGELDEGQSFEAIMLAAKNKLDNLIVIVDRNNIQISGFTEEVMPLNNLAYKWSSFNWNVFEVDGDNFEELNNSIEQAKEKKGKPSVIIANTIPGAGVSFLENNYHWHGAVPNRKQAEAALVELENNTKNNA